MAVRKIKFKITRQPADFAMLWLMAIAKRCLWQLDLWTSVECAGRGRPGSWRAVKGGRAGASRPPNSKPGSKAVAG